MLAVPHFQTNGPKEPSHAGGMAQTTTRTKNIQPK